MCQESRNKTAGAPKMKSKINRHIMLNIIFLLALITLLIAGVFDWIKNSEFLFIFFDSIMITVLLIFIFQESNDLYHLIKIKIEFRKIKKDTGNP